MNRLRPIQQYNICDRINKCKQSGNTNTKTPKKPRDLKFDTIAKHQIINSLKHIEMAGKSFKMNDLVFAKVKGYAPWPGKIINIKNKKYHVYFFGTAETAWVKENNLFSYLENKAIFATEKTMQCESFSSAVNEIESILNGMDFSPTNSANTKEVKSTTSTGLTDGNAEQVNQIQNNVLKADAGANEMESMSTDNRTAVSNAKKTILKSKPVRPSHTIVNNLLLVYMPTAKCLGIDINHGKPERFESIAEEADWMEKSINDAYDLKLKLEAGQLKINSFSDRIVVEPVRYEMPKEEAIRFVKEVINEENALTMELHFIQLTQKLRDSLGFRNPDTSKCLDTLHEFKNINITKLMLLRNPECVDVMRRVQRYKANVAKADIIRKESSEVYNSYKKVFTGPRPPQGYFFWNDLCEKIKVYRTYTKTCNHPFRITLNENPENNLDIPNTIENDGEQIHESCTEA